MSQKDKPQQASTGAKDKNKDGGKKGINLKSTPVTDKVKPEAGTTLHNEGTNVSYEEER